MTEKRSENASMPALDHESRPSVSRRRFMGLAAGTAFVFGFHVPRHRTTEAAERALFAPNAFIRIDRQGNVTLIMPQVEMGQGTYTSISMILAEELDADWNRVRTEHAPPDEKDYANPDLSIQARTEFELPVAWIESSGLA